MSESLRAPEDEPWSSLENAIKVADRDIMGEATAAGHVQGFFIGLAGQQVFKTFDGKLILRESTFEHDGTFTAKISLLDYSAKAGQYWEGRAINNPDHDGLHGDLTGVHYDETLSTVEGLMGSHPVVA